MVTETASNMFGSSADDTVELYERDNSIHFNGGITSKTISQLINKLLTLEDKLIRKQRSLKRKFKDSEDIDEDIFEFNLEPKPIKLYITSNGGYLYQVLSAIDTINSMKVPVHTICKGMVASAGTLLSLAGKKRYITKNAYMLIHELRTSTWGKFTHISESFENAKQLSDHIKQIYIDKTKLTSEELDEQLKKDISWNAETCLEKGLVDEII